MRRVMELTNGKVKKPEEERNEKKAERLEDQGR